MIDKRFPNWEIDIEKGEIYSLYYKRYVVKVKEIHIKDLFGNTIMKKRMQHNYILFHLFQYI